MGRLGEQVGDYSQEPPRSATSIDSRGLDGRDERIMLHLQLVRWVALDVRMSPHGKGAHLEDLEADGALGLVEASVRFDPTRGIPFTVYARLRIRGAMLDGIRGRHSLGRRPYQRQRAGAVPERVVASLDEREPFKRINPFTKPGTDERLLETTEVGQSGARWNGRQMVELPVTDDDTLEILVAEQLEQLSARDQQLVNLCYYEGKTLTEAARQLGIRRSWASRLHARILGTLRAAVGERASRRMKSGNSEPAEAAGGRKQRRLLRPIDEGTS